MHRRSLISLSLASMAAAPLTSIPFAQAQGSQARCAGDETPAQFLPRNAPDPQPQENDLAKFPKCPYCGMDRRQYHHSRMLIQYANDVPDAVCSIHCAAISLSLNIDAEPKAIWVGDNAANGEQVEPLLPPAGCAVLITSRIKFALPGLAEKDLDVWVKNDELEYIGNERHLWVKKDQFEPID